MSVLTSVQKKALALNQDDKIYGTFAEIGAGQEVARHFFQAGLASQTVAKTISAYDMTFSDSIYGKSSRYVSEDRLKQMLAYEFDLLTSRLKSTKAKDSRFFSFADTVSTSSRGDRIPHGWMGVRFQESPLGPANDIIVHVKIKDSQRLLQQETLGVLGVNLVYAAFFHWDDPERLMESLFENLDASRLEIDILRLEGPAFKGIDNQWVATMLVEKEFSKAALIAPDGRVLQVTDCFFNKPIILQRGTFRPITNINIEIINKGIDQLRQETKEDSLEPFPLMEMSINHNVVDGLSVNLEDYLFRAKTIGAVGFYSLISKFDLFYQVKNYLRESTNKKIAMVIGASHLENIFDEGFYKNVSMGVFNALGNLFDEKVQFYVFPFKDDKICMTTQSFNPSPEFVHLYKHSVSNNYIVDIAGCDDLDTSIHSKEVRALLRSGDSQWKQMVPEAVSELILKNNYFKN